MLKKIIGLDIGTSAIKLVELEPNGRDFSFITAARSSAPLKSILSESEIDQKAIATQIAALVGQAKVDTNLVSASLLESQTATKVIEMPLMSDNEVASAIRWEAEQYIPWPITAVALDWQILKRVEKSEKSPESKMDVLLVVAPMVLINKYTKILKMAGLEPVSLETENLALVRTIAYSEDTATVCMLMEMGAATTSICILEKGLLIFTRTVAVGGISITRAVSSELGLEYSQAEEYKKTYGLDKDKLNGKVFNCIKPVIDVILNEVKRAFAFYQNLNTNDVIKRVILSGGSAKLPGLVSYLATELGDVEVSGSDPWKKIKFPKTPSFDPRTEASDYSVAVGLSMKEL